MTALFVRTRQSVDGLSTAQCDQRRDLDIAQDRFRKTAPIASRPSLFCLSERKIEECADDQTLPYILTRKRPLWPHVIRILGLLVEVGRIIHRFRECVGRKQFPLVT